MDLVPPRSPLARRRTEQKMGEVEQRGFEDDSIFSIQGGERGSRYRRSSDKRLLSAMIFSVSSERSHKHS